MQPFPLPRHPLQQAEYVRRLQDLRRACKKLEFGLCGRDAIIAYLNDVCGALNGRRQPINRFTLDTWIFKRGFPVWQISAKDKVRTTNLLILAWLWSYKAYKKTRPKRSSALHVQAALGAQRMAWRRHDAV